MKNKKITQLKDEDRNFLLSKTPHVLPDNPSNKGFTAAQIKQKMYEGYVVLFEWLKRLQFETNDTIEEIKKYTDVERVIALIDSLKESKLDRTGYTEDSDTPFYLQCKEFAVETESSASPAFYIDSNADFQMEVNNYRLTVCGSFNTSVEGDFYLECGKSAFTTSWWDDSDKNPLLCKIETNDKYLNFKTAAGINSNATTKIQYNVLKDTLYYKNINRITYQIPDSTNAYWETRIVDSNERILTAIKMNNEDVSLYAENEITIGGYDGDILSRLILNNIEDISIWADSIFSVKGDRCYFKVGDTFYVDAQNALELRIGDSNFDANSMGANTIAKIGMYTDGTDNYQGSTIQIGGTSKMGGTNLDNLVFDRIRSVIFDVNDIHFKGVSINCEETSIYRPNYWNGQDIFAYVQSLDSKILKLNDLTGVTLFNGYPTFGDGETQDNFSMSLDKDFTDFKEIKVYITIAIDGKRLQKEFSFYDMEFLNEVGEMSTSGTLNYQGISIDFILDITTLDNVVSISKTTTNTTTATVNLERVAIVGKH